MTSRNKKINYNINIIGDIDIEHVQDFFKEIQFVKADKTINELDLNIYSNGGFLHGCFAMIDAVESIRKRRDIKINTYGYGAVVSAGFFLFLLGEKRTIMPNCRLYVHEHINTIDGLTYSKMKELFQEDVLLNKMCIDYVSERLNISKDDTIVLLKKDSWLSKNDIKQFKIVSGGRNEY